MSADLFAEFSTDPVENQQQQSNASTGLQTASTFSFFDDLKSQVPASGSQQPASYTQSYGQTSILPAQRALDDDADDWGDFEGGSGHVDPTPSAQHNPSAFIPSQQSQPRQQALTGSPYAHEPFASQSSHPSFAPQDSWTRAPIIKAKKPTDSNVLFDAEDDLDDDDFGDFEGASTTPAPSAPGEFASNLVDLLGDLDLSQPASSALDRTSTGTRSLEMQPKATTRKSPVESFGTTSRPKRPKSKAAASKAATAPAPEAADDAWDTFDDWEASIPTAVTVSQEATQSTAPQPTSAPAPILSPAVDDILSGEQPPTNVPPPGVLLSLFPSFFAEAQEQLFKPMAAQTLPTRNKLLAEPGTIAYLRGYLMLATVAAHVIAGRKLRWKRDQHLSQGMRIGPASSRATSGMKLTGIDRGENRKEEREASDVVRAWKDQIGRLRHVTSGVNQIKAGTLSTVPDLQETMPVRTLKQSEGGVPARQPCMLCGLKRDERVTAADTAVEDSFGEWWIEQVNMHRGCRNFWNEHKDRLRQR